MKTIVFVTLLFGLAYAELSWETEPLTHDVNNKYDQHFTQHQASIQAARRGVAERLEQLGATAAYSEHGASNRIVGRKGGSSYSDHSSSSHSSNYGCVTGCESTASRLSSNNDAESFGSDIGYGVVGFTGGANERQQYSSSSQHERVQAVAPIQVYPSANTRSRYSSSSHQERQVAAQQVPVVSFPIGGGETSSSSRYSSHQRVGTVQAVPLQVQVYPSGSNSERYVSQSQHVSEHKAVPVAPIYTPSGHERYTGRTESFVEQQVPIAPVYTPSTNSERYSSRSDRITEKVAVPIPVVYSAPSVSQNYARSDSFRETQAAVPVYQPIYQPAQSDRYSSRAESLSERQGTIGAHSVYPIPIEARSQSQLQHESNSHVTSGGVPIIAPSTSSQSAYARHESYANTGRNYVPIVSNPSETSSSSSQYAEQQERRIGGGVIGVGGHVGSSSNDYSRSYGGRYGSTLGASPDLSSYMTESERLAKMQSKSVHNSHQPLTGSSTVDARFGSASSGSGLNSLGGAGYQRTKSWETSSKWASGSQYGDDGKPKSYSMLSTAESENHNINGHETGYKAATTTLDNDGKVSTYSIHTP